MGKNEWYEIIFGLSRKWSRVELGQTITELFQFYVLNYQLLFTWPTKGLFPYNPYPKEVDLMSAYDKPLTIIGLYFYSFPDSSVCDLQCDSVHDVVAAARHRPLQHVLRHLSVHRARRAELRAHDWSCVQCCCKYICH